MIFERNGYRIAYDELADTLYVSNGQPQPASESVLDEDDVLLRFVAGRLQALTITGFVERHQDGSWSDRLILNYLPSFPVDAVRLERFAR